MKLHEIYNIDSRKSFVETWLKEMPSGLGQFETLDAIKYSIRDLLKHGIRPTVIRNDLFVIGVGTTVIYWIGTDDGSEVKLAVQLRKESEALVVSMLGKDKGLQGKPPFATQLYSDILKNEKENIRIMSDKFLSDEGFAVWKKLVSMGHSVSVYDSEQPGKTFQTFDEPDELESFFADDDTDFSKYQFIMSENVDSLIRIRPSFQLRKHRESVSGLL